MKRQMPMVWGVVLALALAACGPAAQETTTQAPAATAAPTAQARHCSTRRH